MIKTKKKKQTPFGVYLSFELEQSSELDRFGNYPPSVFASTTCVEVIRLFVGLAVGYPTINIGLSTSVLTFELTLPREFLFVIAYKIFHFSPHKRSRADYSSALRRFRDIQQYILNRDILLRL